MALTLAVTPNLAEAGRALAGRLRRRRQVTSDPELQPRDMPGPVFIVGMGPVGRTLADALTEFEIGYAAVERDQRQFSLAVADGYAVAFGDASDHRIWEPLAMQGRRITVITAPRFETSRDITPLISKLFPNLKRFAVVTTEEDRERFAGIGLTPVLDRSKPPGLDVAMAVLSELGIDDEKIGDWMRRAQERLIASREDVLQAAE